MAKGLFGHVVIRGTIIAKTGLHIGASADTVEIGGIDTPVIKHPVTFDPYIPGSSLKGKMRALLEKIKVGEGALEYNRNVAQKIFQHVCNDSDDSDKSTPGAKNCEVCRVFGSTGKTRQNKNHPGRILVRDAKISNKNDLRLDKLPVMEAKMENVLDRVYAAATPRTIERVPAGAKFNFEIVYRVEGESDKQGIQNDDKIKIKTDIQNIFLLLRAVEREGLGGNTSRGHGQVSFQLTEFFYQKVKENDSTFQFPKENEGEVRELEKVIQDVNKDGWELKGLCGIS